MPAKPMSLGQHNFDKKGDAFLYLKEMLAKYDVGDSVSEADSEVLSAAIARHPDADEKIGAGIAGFSVRSADFGSKCFWLNRIDGSTVKFSYKSCIY